MSKKSAEIIKRHMDEAGLTGGDIAQVAGVSRQAVSMWAHGNYQPSLLNLTRLAASPDPNLRNMACELLSILYPEVHSFMCVASGSAKRAKTSKTL